MFLFPSQSITKHNLSHPDPSFSVRPLHSEDWKKGHCHVLSNLTIVGEVTEEQWKAQFLSMKNTPNTYYIIVIEDVLKGRIVASGSLVVERKFIRNVGFVGHIEDIVVDKSYQKKRLGLILVQNLMAIGDDIGCYKLVLDCSEKNEPFYKNCGFTKKEIQMVRYRPKSKL